MTGGKLHAARHLDTAKCKPFQASSRLTWHCYMLHLSMHSKPVCFATSQLSLQLQYRKAAVQQTSKLVDACFQQHCKAKRSRQKKNVKSKQPGEKPLSQTKASDVPLARLRTILRAILVSLLLHLPIFDSILVMAALPSALVLSAAEASASRRRR